MKLLTLPHVINDLTVCGILSSSFMRLSVYHTNKACPDMKRLRSLRLLTLLIIVFVTFFIAGPTPSVAQVGDLHAELKVGLLFDATVEEVTAWGFWLTSGQGLLYRQLITLTTDSDSLISEIKRFLPEAPVKQNGITHIVHFEGLDIPTRTYRERTALGHRHLLLGATVGHTGDVEVQFNISTRYTGPLVFQLAHAIGWGLSDSGGFLGGYTAGLGASYPRGQNTWVVMFNVWKKYFQNERDGPGAVIRDTGGWIGSTPNIAGGTITDRKPDAYSVTLFYNRSLGAGRYMLSSGVRYYFKNVEFRGTVPRFGIILSTGINL